MQTMARDGREISVEVDVHPGAAGSSRVVLGSGESEAMAVVKVGRT
jgi:exosome complex RNA-binding protein Rrp42 (RNase PH superfamily)